MRPQNRAFLQLLVAAALFSTGGAVIKGIDFGVWEVAGFRSLIAGVTIGAFLRSSRGRWNRGVLGVGSAYAATVVLFVVANRLTTAASAVFLQYTAPLYVALLSQLTLGEKVKLRDLGFLAALLLGLACFLFGPDATSISAPQPRLGNLIASCSGLAYAALILGIRRLERDGQTVGVGATGAICGNFMAFAICLPLMSWNSSVALSDWMGLLYLGLFQLGLGYVFMTLGMRCMGAFEASLILLVEPLLNPLWAFLLEAEKPGLWSLVGGAIILCAATYRGLLERSREPAAEEVAGGTE